jgi:hypothetical protein
LLTAEVASGPAVDSPPRVDPIVPAQRISHRERKEFTMNATYPVICAEDIAACSEFYVSLFGFRPVFEVDF